MAHEYITVAEGIRKELKRLVDEIHLLRQAIERGVDTDPLAVLAQAMSEPVDVLQRDADQVKLAPAEDPLADVPEAERYRFAPID